MEINDRIRELIAVGASLTANCQPCLQLHVEKAIAAGATAAEVAAAMEVGNRVKKGAVAKMETFAAGLTAAVAPVAADVVVSGNGREFLGP